MAKPRKYTQIYAETKNGWSHWRSPIFRGHRCQCCDCGLVHEYDFRIRNGRVEMRSRRDEAETKRVRKLRKEEV